MSSMIEFDGHFLDACQVEAITSPTVTSMPEFLSYDVLRVMVEFKINFVSGAVIDISREAPNVASPQYDMYKDRLMSEIQVEREALLGLIRQHRL